MMILTSETFQQISPATFGFRLTLSVLIKTIMEGDSSRDRLIP